MKHKNVIDWRPNDLKSNGAGDKDGLVVRRLSYTSIAMTFGGSQVMISWKLPSRMRGGGRRQEERWMRKVSEGSVSEADLGVAIRLEVERGSSTKRTTDDGVLGGFRNTWVADGVTALDRRT